MDRGAWQVVVHRVPRVGPNLVTKPANIDAKKKKKKKKKPGRKGEKENKRGISSEILIFI